MVPPGECYKHCNLCARVPHPKVDGNLLRRNQIAPGNEYKVVGALKFLGIIDDEGRPTEKSRLLKTKGPSFTSALRNIIRSAYKNLFQRLNGGAYTAEDIYNYFITDEDLTPEMATKTTRFFIQLCQLAEIDLGLTAAERKKSGSNGHRKQGKGQYSQIGVCPMIETGNLNHIPLVLALTPEMASMDSEQLAEFFKKLKTALAKAKRS
ncbi:DUF5343 domain-containing protein [Dehalococcoidia bacterium]|nr:DUF5343 domain-containing protein [Dehalococcoidia bacterium]